MVDELKKNENDEKEERERTQKKEGNEMKGRYDCKKTNTITNHCDDLV